MHPGEAFEIPFVRLAQNSLALADDLIGPAVVKDLGHEQADVAVMVLGVVPRKESLAEGACVLDRTEASGNSGRYFKVLTWLSENGLSSETWSRLWVLVTPRSANSKATGLDLIEAPRSAWRVAPTESATPPLWSGSLRPLSLRCGAADSACPECNCLRFDLSMNMNPFSALTSNYRRGRCLIHVDTEGHAQTVRGLPRLPQDFRVHIDVHTPPELTPETYGTYRLLWRACKTSQLPLEWRFHGHSVSLGHTQKQ